LDSTPIQPLHGCADIDLAFSENHAINRGDIAEIFHPRFQHLPFALFSHAHIISNLGRNRTAMLFHSRGASHLILLVLCVWKTGWFSNQKMLVMSILGRRRKAEVLAMV